VAEGDPVRRQLPARAPSAPWSLVQNAWTAANESSLSEGLVSCEEATPSDHTASGLEERPQDGPQQAAYIWAQAASPAKAQVCLLLPCWDSGSLS
jgi:hypothetical protein